MSPRNKNRYENRFITLSEPSAADISALLVHYESDGWELVNLSRNKNFAGGENVSLSFVRLLDRG